MNRNFLFLAGLAAVSALLPSAFGASLREGELGAYPRAQRTAVATSGGKWLIAASVALPGAENPLAKVHLWESADGGASWSTPKPLSEGPFEETGPGLGVSEKGTLLLNYSTSLGWALEGEIADPALRAWWEKVKTTSLGETNAAVNFWMRRSTDGGATWSAPYEIPCNPLGGALALGEGSLFLFGHRGTDSIRQMIGGERNNFILSNAVSTDDGQTWKRVKDLGAVDGAGLVAECLHESGAALGPGGEVAVFLRNPYSPGKTQLKRFGVERAKPEVWSAQRPAGEAAAFHVASLPGEKVLMSYLEAGGNGTRLLARVSADGGTTWEEAGAIAEGGGAIRPGFSSVALEDGSVLTAWFEESAAPSARLRYRVWKR